MKRPSAHEVAFLSALPIRWNHLASRKHWSSSAEPHRRSVVCSATRGSVSELKLHKLGSSDLEVTEVCLGTMTWGVQNSLSEALDQMNYAIKERGINFLDTAEMYPVPASAPGQVPGRTEEYIGEFISQNKSLRDKLIVATKIVGHSPNSRVAAFRYPDKTFKDGQYPNSFLDRKSIFDACDASLRRLQTDYIDLYQFHWPDRYVPMFGPRAYDPTRERQSTSFKESLGAVKELMEQGKIRAYGLSNETTYGVAECVRAADELGMPRPVSIQNQFCLLNRSFETELAEACAPSHYNLALMPYSILAGGILSGKYLGKVDALGNVTDPNLEKSRFGLFKGFMQRYAKGAVLDATKRYQQIAKEAGISLATLSQAFCKSRFFIPSSIIGATDLDQLKENIDAFSVDLDPEVLAKIDEVHSDNKDVAAIAV